MKNQFLSLFIALFIISACSNDNVDPVIQDQLEQRGNDNHKIYKLSQVTGQWNYTLSDGFSSSGTSLNKFVYSCSRPVGRAIASTDYLIENGVVYWDISRTMSYNENFMVSVENALEYGDEIVRTFQYDSNNKWTGIITTVNGEVIEDEIEISPSGQVLSYTHDGTRTEYVWKADNITKIKTYVQVTAALSSVQNSLRFLQLGFNKISNTLAKEKILNSLENLQKSNRTVSPLRGAHSDEWTLVFVDEQIVDKNVIQPYTSVSAGYPGTTTDGGYLTLPKNFIVNFKGYNVNPDGSMGELAYLVNFDSYTRKNNLPVNVNFSSFYADYEEDEDGNFLDYTDTGSIQYEYISGCNQKLD